MSDSNTLFVFGTMMDDDVLELISGRPAQASNPRLATLPGFEPRYIKKWVNPVLVLSARAITKGRLLDGLDVNLYHYLIKRYGQELDLCDISVKTKDNDDFSCRYFAYVGNDEITETRWNFDVWKQRHKAQFLVDVAKFIDEYKSLGSPSIG